MTEPAGQVLPLRRNRPFLALWAAKTITDLGSGVTLLVVPLIAVQLLVASVFQVSLIQAANSLAFLVAALPFGVLLQRLPERASMIVADLARAVFVTLIVVAAVLGRLSVGVLVALVVGMSVGAVAFEAASQVLVSQILPAPQLLDANGRLTASGAFALVLGPALGGVLVAVVGSTLALVAAGFCHGVSGCLMLLTRTRERHSRPGGPRPFSSPGAELVAGLRYISRDRVLTALLSTGTVANFFAQFMFAVEVIFLVRVLQMPPGLVALPFGLAAAGGIVGGMSAAWLASAIGTARVLWLAPLCAFSLMWLLPLSSPGAGVTWYVIGVTGFFAGSAVLSSGHDAYTQMICPPDMLSRVVSSNRWAVWGVMPLGAVSGGLLATQLGVRATLMIGAFGAWISVGLLLASPLRAMRNHPPPDAANGGP